MIKDAANEAFAGLISRICLGESSAELQFAALSAWTPCSRGGRRGSRTCGKVTLVNKKICVSYRVGH